MDLIAETINQYLVVGLGNPGKQYALTRHNIGYLVVQELAALKSWSWKEDKGFSAQIAKGKIEDKMVHLLLPLTYMNESGRAVKSYMKMHQLNVAHLIIVVDDVALDFGQMRIRLSGSSGGHNGLKSIQNHLQTLDYLRLRIGIGPQQLDLPLADYVLDTFSSSELKKLPNVVQGGVNAVLRLIAEDPATVMNSINLRQ